MPYNEDQIISDIECQFGIEDVGSTLLHELAKELYQPYEVLREYIQNAVDAHRLWKNETGDYPEQPIHIEVMKNGISIFDYGIGMDEKGILKVKSIALSAKRSADIPLTGHKGVGIWAGLSFFETMTVYSTQKGSEFGYELKINFKNIVNSISDDANIGEVLNPNLSAKKIQEKRETHYTVVSLEGPIRSSDIFTNADKIEEAVKTICPCPIDSNFVFHTQVSDWYKNYGFEAFPIMVERRLITRAYPNNIEDFKTETITLNDKIVAVLWKAHNKGSGILKPVSGFRIFINGFVLGEANIYSQKNLPGFDDVSQTLSQWLDWHVGEIHIMAPDLKPDLPRRRFEESEDSRQFIKKLREWYKKVEGETRALSERNKIVKRYKENMETVEKSIRSNNSEPLSGILQKLKEEEEIVHSGKRNPEASALRHLKDYRHKIINKINDALSSEESKADLITTEYTQLSFTPSESRPDFSNQSITVKKADQIVEEIDLTAGPEPMEIELTTEKSINYKVMRAMLEQLLDNSLPADFSDKQDYISKLLAQLDTITMEAVKQYEQ